MAGAKGIPVTIPSTSPPLPAISSRDEWIELCEQWIGRSVDALGSDLALATFTNVLEKKRGHESLQVEVADPPARVPGDATSGRTMPVAAETRQSV